MTRMTRNDRGILLLLLLLLPLTLAAAATGALTGPGFSCALIDIGTVHSAGQRLVCHVFGPDPVSALTRLPRVAAPGVAGLSLIVAARSQLPGSPGVSLRAEHLAGYAAGWSIRSLHIRGGVGLAECSLRAVAGPALETLELYGVQLEADDPLCQSEGALSGLAALALGHPPPPTSLSPAVDGCQRWRCLLDLLLSRAGSGLASLTVGLPDDCPLAGFRLPRPPPLSLRRLLLRTRDGVFSQGSPDSLDGFSLAGMPVLRSLTLALDGRFLRCSRSGGTDGAGGRSHVFGPRAFSNLPSLQSLLITGLTIVSGSLRACTLMSPGAFNAGSVSLRSVALGTHLRAGQLIVDLGNSSILQCQDCRSQTLMAWDTDATGLLNCALRLPTGPPPLNLTRLRVSGCAVGPTDARLLSSMPAVRSLQFEASDNPGAEPPVRLFILDEFREILTGGGGGKLDRLSVFADQCVCPTLSKSRLMLTPTPPQPQSKPVLSIRCRNLPQPPQPFASLAAALRACAGTAAFLDQAAALRSLALVGSRRGSGGLDGIADGAFAGASGLVALSLRNNRLTTLTAGSFADLGRLRWLDLTGSRLLTRVHPDAMRPMSASLELLRVGLGGGNARTLPALTGGGGDFGLPRLADLSVHVSACATGAAVVVAIPPGAIVGLPALRRLAVSADGGCGAAFQAGAVADLPSLRWLHLSAVSPSAGAAASASVTFEPGAFARLSGGLSSLLVEPLLPPEADASDHVGNWLELLNCRDCESGDADDGLEVTLGFSATWRQPSLTGWLPGHNATFNAVTALTLRSEAPAYGRRILTATPHDVAELLRRLPCLNRLSLRSCISLRPGEDSRRQRLRLTRRLLSKAAAAVITGRRRLELTACSDACADTVDDPGADDGRISVGLHCGDVPDECAAGAEATRQTIAGVACLLTAATAVAFALCCWR